MLLAFTLSLLAGLSTSIGGALALHRRFLNRSFLAIAMAFSAGAMLLVSFLEILPLGFESLSSSYDTQIASFVLAGSFLIGLGLVALIDTLLPKSINPSELEGREQELTSVENKTNRRLMRSGTLVAVVLALHNFPEGMVTFFATYQDIAAGMVLVLAVAIHNIPEGVAVAAPIYAATKSRKKAFWWATLSGLTEPLGALLAFGLVSVFMPGYLFGVMFGLVAGMMVFIAVHELLPGAYRYQVGSGRVLGGTLAGATVISVSLLII